MYVYVHVQSQFGQVPSVPAMGFSKSHCARCTVRGTFVVSTTRSILQKPPTSLLNWWKIKVTITTKRGLLLFIEDVGFKANLYLPTRSFVFDLQKSTKNKIDAQP